MTPSLPEQPNLRHLRNQAKAILKSHKQGDLSICQILRLVPRLSELSDLDMLADVGLQEVQHALAKQYGFATWDALKADVTARGGAAADDSAGRLRIPKATGEPIDLEAAGITRGFRYDPMNWVSNSRTLAAAQVRKMVFDQPLDGDEEILDARINEILSDWPPEDAERLSGRLGDLLDLGCPPDRPEITQVLATECPKYLFPPERLPYFHVEAPLLRTACLAGWQDGAEPAATLGRLASLDGAIVGDCDPWVWARSIKALLAGRHLTDVAAALDSWMAFRWSCNRRALTADGTI
jgi:hypothetical protein